uniref:Neurogenic locus Notch protein n=1 Tax=Panagrellus redivivus TaxID=6233 RepID=A0A7E4V5V6_PANRE
MQLLSVLSVFGIIAFGQCQLIGDTCTVADCNQHGNCLGSRAAPLCFCHLGYSGARCELGPCDSKASCNGNGFCIGNSQQSSCLCNLGFYGLRCENSFGSGISPNGLNGLGGLMNIFGRGTDPMNFSTDENADVSDAAGTSTDFLSSLPNLLTPLMDPSQFSYADQYLSSYYNSPANDSLNATSVNPLSAPKTALSPQRLRSQPMNLQQMLNNKGAVSPNNIFGNSLSTSFETCDATDCNGNGVCVGSKTLPVCLCHLGFTGLKCENSVFEKVSSDLSGATIVCSASDCNNNGICLGTKASFICSCKLGFAGTRCESTPYPLCDASDCNNNGLCIGTKQSFTCACHLGFSGSRCDKAAGTLCDVSDCNTQGLCMGTKDQFTCLCNLGYGGKRCENRLIDTVAPLAGGLFCELKDCNNNGLCVGTKLLPTCLCNLGYLGLRCELEPLCIPALQCSSNGVCFGTQKNYICACNLGWSGPNCQYFIGKK